MPDLGPMIVQSLLTAAAAWAAVRVELRWLRRDVDRAHERLDRNDVDMLNLIKEKR